MTVGRVMIFATDTPRPIYHQIADVEMLPSFRYVAVTVCGRTEPEIHWWSAHLRREHADLFARPCHTCFKENS